MIFTPSGFGIVGRNVEISRCLAHSSLITRDVARILEAAQVRFVDYVREIFKIIWMGLVSGGGRQPRCHSTLDSLDGLDDRSVWIDTAVEICVKIISNYITLDAARKLGLNSPAATSDDGFKVDG